MPKKRSKRRKPSIHSDDKQYTAQHWKNKLSTTKEAQRNKKRSF